MKRCRSFLLRLYKGLPFLRNEEGNETEPSPEKEIQQSVIFSKPSHKEKTASTFPSLPDSPPLSPGQSSSSDDNSDVTPYSNHEDLADVYPEGSTDAIGTDCGGPTDVSVKYNHSDRRRSPLFVQEFLLEMTRLSQPRRSYSMKMDFLDEMEEYSSETPWSSGVTSSEESVSEDGGVSNRLRGIASLDANTRKLLQKELFQSLRMPEWQHKD